MIRYNTTKKFNQLDSVKYNSQVLTGIEQVYTRLGPRPIVLDQNRNALAVLENSYDVILNQVMNGENELSFCLPFFDSKERYLNNENLIQMFNTLYVIREVIRKKGTDTPYVLVTAQALWYDLQFADPLTKTVWTDQMATVIFSELLQGTDWSLGNVEYTNRRSLVLDEDTGNPLQGISQACSLFGANLDWDTDKMILHVLQDKHVHSGTALTYRKNIQDIEVFNDTKDLVTRLFVYGAEGLTIADANNGVSYLEDYSFTDKRRVRSIRNERFTNPFALKEFGEEKLKILSRPKVTYRMTAAVLSELTGLAHEKFGIGSIVRVHDKELGIDEDTRILSWSYDVIYPANTRIELESRIMGLSDLLSEADLDDGGFNSEHSMRNEIMELTVFNHLLNSRADDGYSSWASSGWDIDAENGFSGSASFRAEGNFNQTKSLRQTVYPSHRNSYSISFRGYVNSIIKGPDGRVGVNILVTYDDGTTEEKFISLV